MDDVAAALAALSCHDAESVGLSRQAGIFERQRPASTDRFGSPIAWKPDPAHAGSERRGALDRSHYRAALAQVRGVVGLRISVLRQCGKSHHWTSTMRWAILSPNGDRASSTLEGFFDLAGLQPPRRRAVPIERGSPRSDMVGRRRPVFAGSGRAFGTGSADHGDSYAGQRCTAGHSDAGGAQPVPRPSSLDHAGRASPGGRLEGIARVATATWITSCSRRRRIARLSVAVTALDESGNATVKSKAQPVIGMWTASDPQGTAPPAFTPSPFNQYVSA